MAKSILNIGDLQSGSIWALWHPQLTDIGEKTIGLNEAQKYLWECWEHFLKWVDEHPLDGIVFGGDLFEGQQPKDGGRTLMAIDHRWQRRNLEHLLEPLKQKPVKKYVIRGSAYHESPDDVEGIAEWLGAEKDPETGDYTFEYLFLDVEGKVINFFHEISPSVGFYVTTALERENMWSRINSPKMVKRPVDYNIRFHIHQATGVSHSATATQICPGWQLQTKYMRRKPRSMYRMLPEIGGMILIVNGEDNSEPFRVKKMTYDLPAYSVIPL